MPARTFGTLEPVPIRDLWPDEAHDFTRWLASEAGLRLLSETIEIDLELIGREQAVGPYRADVLARYANEEEDRYVVIENQFGRTNHDHLGKIVTYSAGLRAATIVWIAETITEEHRQALDWLNENVGQALAFFGLEIQLWRIGDSLPAPQLRIVSSPNEWAKAVQTDDSGEPSDRKLNQLRFWEELRGAGMAQRSHLPLRKPQPQHWYVISLGKSGVHLSLTVHISQKRIGCEVFVTGKMGKGAFDLLHAQQADIERELGSGLDWQRLDHRKGARIALYKSGVDIDDAGQRQLAIEWLLHTAAKFHTVFAPRVRTLDLAGEEENGHDDTAAE